MKPLNLKETALKEEMKERCLTKGQYIDENAKAKFEMLCHLEDFEVQYWELQQENKQLKDNWNKLKIWLEEYNIANEKWYSNELSNHDREYYKKDYLDCKFFINKFIDKMQELEKGVNNE